MWAIRCALVVPNHEPALSEFSFWVTACIMMLLAAGGNVINDYFDVQEDAINKPKRAFVGRVISRRKTLFFHHFLTGMAVVMSAVMSWDERSVWPFAWTVVMATLLWGYSPWFKRRFLRGNVVIALLVGQLPFWAVIGEVMDAHSHAFFFSNDGITLMIYAALSAALTFLREVTKDLQDREGDALTGFDTLAVRWGTQRTWRLLDWTHGLFWIPLIATSFLRLLCLRCSLDRFMLSTALCRHSHPASTKTADFHQCVAKTHIVRRYRFSTRPLLVMFSTGLK